MLVSRLLSSKSGNRKTSTSPPFSTPSPVSSNDVDNKATLETDVHPSLVEYLSMFPPQHGQHTVNSLNPPIPSPSFTRTFSDRAPQAQLDNQRVIYSPQPGSVNAQDGQFPLSLWQSSSHTPSSHTTHTNEPLTYHEFTNQVYLNPESSGFGIKADSPESNLMDLGMMMSGDSGMDQQWMSFMRDSGLLDGNMNTM